MPNRKRVTLEPPPRRSNESGQHTVVATSHRVRTKRSNRGAENSFSHDASGGAATSTGGSQPPRPTRTRPQLQQFLLQRGITVAEIDAAANAFDNGDTQSEYGRLASANRAYLTAARPKTTPIKWCVVPGYKHDARRGDSTALEAHGWAGHTYAYRPEDQIAAQADAEASAVAARQRLLDETKDWPRVHAAVQAMGTHWQPQSEAEADARERVLAWLLNRVGER